MGSNHVNVANDTDSTVKVLVSPNKDWKIADLIVGFGGIVIDGIGVINAVKDLENLFSEAKLAGDAVQFFENIESLFTSHGINVAPRTVKDVNDHGLANPFDYFTPSGWAAVCGGSDLTLTVLMINNDSTKQLAQFNTNSDWSWIIHGDRINRSKKGHKWMDDPSHEKPWQ